MQSELIGLQRKSRVCILYVKNFKTTFCLAVTHQLLNSGIAPFFFENCQLRISTNATSLDLVIMRTLFHLKAF